ncbi:MAG: InlB B-repeat-containing protein [Saccharofermentanales bacterium]
MKTFKNLKYLITTILLLVFLLAGAPATNGAAMPSDREIEVTIAADPVSNNLDLTGFSDKLKARLLTMGVNPDKVHINAVESSLVSGGVNWNRFDHTNNSGLALNTPSSIVSYYGEYYSNLIRNSHIVTSGNSIGFYGYGSPAYKDFLLSPNANATNKIFTFEIDESIVDWHTGEGAGFLFNAKYTYISTSDRRLSCYVVLLGQSSINLFRLDNVEIGQFMNEYNYGLSSLAPYAGYSYNIWGGKVSNIASVAKPAASSGTKRFLKLVASPEAVSFYQFTDATYSVVNNKMFENIALSVSFNSFGFGPIVSYLSHGCSSLTNINFSNVTMVEDTSIGFTDMVKSTSWQYQDSLRLIVNVDNDGVPDFGNTGKLSTNLYYTMLNSVHYVGWGLNNAINIGGQTSVSGQTNAFITRNNSRGTFINRTNTSTDSLDEGVDALALYIYNQLLLDVEFEKPVINTTFNGSGNVTCTTTTVETSLGNPVGAYEWRALDVATGAWTSLPDNDNSTTISFPQGAYRFISLRIKDSVTNMWSDYAQSFVAYDTNAIAVAQYSLDYEELMPDTSVLELRTPSFVTVTDNSYHPSGEQLTAWEWKVYNSSLAEQTDLAKTYTNYNIPPTLTFNFSAKPAGTYTIRLRVKKGTTDWSSYFSQTVKVYYESNEIDITGVGTPPAGTSEEYSGTKNFEFGIIGSNTIAGYQIIKVPVIGGDTITSSWIKTSNVVVNASGTVSGGSYSVYVLAKDILGNSKTELIGVYVTDTDGDGVLDDVDLFPLDDKKADGVDTDGDGTDDMFDTDDDNDGVLDTSDLYPLNDKKADGVDTDGDGTDDLFDTDDDNDGVADINDQYPLDDKKADGVDTDNDGTDNVFDADDDNDGVADINDQYPLDGKKADGVDTDNDGTDDLFDTDDDNDGYLDINDLYPTDKNKVDGIDNDADQIDDIIDTDDDNDNVSDINEAKQHTNPNVADTDSDGVNDDIDQFPLNSRKVDGIDFDKDGTDDVVDTDDDNDGLPDEYEAIIGTNPKNKDTDGDGFGDSVDLYPLDANKVNGFDTDNDGIDDIIDQDDDNDTIPDAIEIALGTNPKLKDTDFDGYNDNIDIAPVDNKRATGIDTDVDGIDDVFDTDDDNDGYSDIYEQIIGTNPLIADTDNDGYKDSVDLYPLDSKRCNGIDFDHDNIDDVFDTDDDNDGLSDHNEGLIGTNPKDADSDDDGYIDGTDLFPLDNKKVDGVDTDNDGTDDLFDTDDDNDGVLDAADLYPLDDKKADGIDTDGDGTDDLFDNDDDNDGVLDAADLYPLDDKKADGIDTDGDGTDDLFDNDDDNDGVLDAADLYPLDDKKADGIDTDGDGTDDMFDTDDDNDGVLDAADLYPLDDKKADGIDTDGDGTDDLFDTDDDNDGVADVDDQFPLDDKKADGTDTDGDGTDDLFDNDDDNDGVLDAADLYPLDDKKADGIDTDNDGTDDLFDTDDDNDGVADVDDQFPLDDKKADGTDTDGDGTDDMFDTDDDNDGVKDTDDLFPLDDKKADGIDTDGDGTDDLFDTDDDNDGVADVDDQYPLDDKKADGTDTDNDGTDDMFDTDDDNDGVADVDDQFPLDDKKADGTDTDNDGTDDMFDTDDDNDGVADVDDQYPLDEKKADGIDTDGDGTDDMFDTDDDNDGVADVDDQFPLDEKKADGTDTDGDGTDDMFDTDDDNDGVADVDDQFPLDDKKADGTDTDNDGTDDMFDTDDDNDGVADVDDQFPLDDKKADAIDTDNDGSDDLFDTDDDDDGLTDAEEEENGTDILKVNFTISFDSQGGSPVSDQYVEQGDYANIPAIPVKTGFTFKGWYQDVECSIIWNFASSIPTESMTLFARWTETVTSLSDEAIEVIGKIDVLPAPETTTDEDINRLKDDIIDAKKSYDELSEDDKASIPGEAKQKLDTLIYKLTALLVIIGDDGDTGVTSEGIGVAVPAPEMQLETTEKVVIEIKVEDISTDSNNENVKKAKDAFDKNNDNLIIVLDIELVKTIYGIDGSIKSERVPNSEITDSITLRIPVPDKFTEDKNLVVVYIDDNGNMTELETIIIVIDGIRYAEFKTIHFSSYALIERSDASPETGDSFPAGILVLLMVSLASVIGLFGRKTARR